MDYVKKGKELRKKILQEIFEAKSGHPGGSLSIVEILMALYYGGVMDYDAKDPKKNDRDLFVLSKGHACPALYAILNDIGLISDSELLTLRKTNSKLQGHPDIHKTKGIEVNTGSLGQGVSVAVGLALAAKRKFDMNLVEKWQNVYTIIGDGESAEGLVWEAAMSAAHYKLDNFTIILDNNGLQIDGKNDEVMSLGDITKKFESFGFATFKVDGHNVDEIINALKSDTNGRPRFICAKTIKGKGVSFMENQVGWHGKAPNEEEFNNAMKELEV